jgi:hypothetical protein
VWGREGRRRNFWVPSLPVSESEGLRVLKKSERDGMVGGGEARRGGGKTTTRRRAECGSGSGESDVWRSHQLSPAQLGLKKFSRDRFLGAELWCSHPEFPNNVIDSTEF